MKFAAVVAALIIDGSADKTCVNPVFDLFVHIADKAATGQVRYIGRRFGEVITENREQFRYVFATKSNHRYHVADCRTFCLYLLL